MCPLDSLVELRILEHEERRFSTSLQSNVLHVDSSHLHDLLSSARASSESNLVNTEMCCNSRTSLSPVTIEDVDNSWWETSFLDQVRKNQDTERSLFRSFNHNCIPTRQRRTQFPRRHSKRIIPRNDLAADTHWLSNGISKLRWSSINDLAMDLIRITTIVFQNRNHLSNIAQGVIVCLAIVPGLDRGEEFGILRAEVREYHHHVAAVGGGHVAPGGVFECFAGSGDGCVDIFGGGSVDRGDFRFITADMLGSAMKRHTH